MTMLRVSWVQSRMRGHEYWERTRLLKLQDKRQRKLREYAYRFSPFYRRFHQGLESAPLFALPVLTKSQLMENYDDIVADQRIRLADIYTHMVSAPPGQPYLHDYRIVVTSGSSGTSGVFIFDPWMWANIIGMEFRLLDFAGNKTRLNRRNRCACITSSLQWHQSWQIAHTFSDKPSDDYLYLSAQDPMAKLVDELNRFKPDSVITYANLLYELAEESLNKHLTISPRSLYCGGETLTDAMRARIVKAFKQNPFNLYGLVEAGNIASECEQRSGMHINEDLIILENVDENNQAVPPNTVGAKVLLTVLFSRVLPIIRYEVTDRIAISDETCPCKRTFCCIAKIEGRVEDTITLEDSKGNEVVLHPNFFHTIFDTEPISAWQIIEDNSGLTVRLVPSKASPFDAQTIKTKLTAALGEVNITSIGIHVLNTNELLKGKTGKTKLIISQKDLQR